MTYTTRGTFIQDDTKVRWSAFEPLRFVLRVEEVRAVEDAFEGFGDMVFGGIGYVVERKLHKVLVFTPRSLSEGKRCVDMGKGMLSSGVILSGQE